MSLWAKKGSALLPIADLAKTTLTNSVVMKIRQSASQLHEVAFGSLFRNADWHELGQEGHDNPKQAMAFISAA